MDPSFWQERWQRNEIGFHQGAPHPALARFWNGLGLPRGTRVLVPLAGKSLDMLWLAAAGHRVVGVELSPIAVRDFYAEHGLQPEVEARGELVLHRAGDIELWCGDVFALTPALLGPVAGAFDRAALVALPPAMRQRYAAQLSGLLPPGARTLLVTMEYDQRQMPGPPHAVLPDEVQALFSAAHEITLLGRDAALADFPKFAERGVTALAEGFYRLERRAAAAS
jgi:thiopurine S-methyltransferase